jgi:hypothetical protein
MRRRARRRDRSGRKPPPGAGKRSSAAEAADNGEQDPEHRAFFRDLGFLPHNYDKNATFATNSLRLTEATLAAALSRPKLERSDRSQ